MAKEETRIEKFWNSYIHNPKTDCLIYIGWMDKDGYGRIKWPIAGERRVHRIAWALTYGKIPKDLLVLHKCDVTLCFNPEHLFLGTPDDNAKDMIKKGRSLAHEKNPSSYLKEGEVSDIRELISQGKTLQSVADLYGVSKGHVSNIKRKHVWK